MQTCCCRTICTPFGPCHQGIRNIRSVGDGSRRSLPKWLASGGREIAISEASHAERRRSIWQRRDWEHTLESEDDFERHFDYVHWNPVKHGYVKYPYQWPHSTFHRYVERGVYDRRWGCFVGAPPPESVFKDIKKSVGE